MTERGEIVWLKPTTNLRRIGSAAAASVLVLSACSPETSEEAPTVTHTITSIPPVESPTLDNSTPTATITPDADNRGDLGVLCALRESWNGEYYSPENIQRISDQVQALNGLYGLDDSFQLRSNLTVFPTILTDSFRDAEYGHALYQAVTQLNQGVPVDPEKFLNYNVMEIGAYECDYTDEANFHFISANQNIRLKLNSHISTQSSEVARQAVEAFEKLFDQLRERIESDRSSG